MKLQPLSPALRHPVARLALALILALAVGVAAPARSQTVAHEILAFTGDTVPGIPTAQYTNLENATTSADGRVILQSYMSGPGINSGNNRAFWTSAPGGAPATMVARSGDTGPSSAIYAGFNYPRIAPGGKVGFLASNSNMAQVSSLICVAGDPGALSTVAYTTMSPPGAAKKIAVPVTEAVASSGALLVSALLEGLTSSGIWRGVPGNLTKIATTGDAAPGLPGVTFTSATISNMSGNGTVAFLGNLSGDLAFNESVWRWTPESMSLVIRKGSTVLGGEVVTQLGRPAVNDAGAVVFLATTSTGGKGLWISSPSGAQRLVAEGQAAPGLEGWSFSSFEMPSINAGGQVAFEATLKNGLATQKSLWLRKADGSLHLLARVDGTLPTRTAPGTVSSLYTGSYALSDDGRVVFIAQVGSQFGLYRAGIPLAAKTPPVVRLSGKVFRTTTSHALVRGTVSSSSPVSRVMVRPAAAKTYAKARGTTKWSARVRVPPGRSKAFVQAVGTDGIRSKIVTARILRTN
jgi:hypothetical protein